MIEYLLYKLNDNLSEPSIISKLLSFYEVPTNLK